MVCAVPVPVAGGGEVRLDARKGDTRFRLYDAKRCLVPQGVVWVDTETAQWGQTDYEASRLSHSHETVTIQEESITVYLDKQLIVFNEVEDDSPSIEFAILHDLSEEIANASAYKRHKSGKAS